MHKFMGMVGKSAWQVVRIRIRANNTGRLLLVLRVASSAPSCCTDETALGVLPIVGLITQMSC